MTDVAGSNKRNFLKGIGASALGVTLSIGISKAANKISANENSTKIEKNDKKLNVSIHPNAVKRTSRG